MDDYTGLWAWPAVAGGGLFLWVLLTGRLFRKPPFGEGGSG